MNKNIKLAVAGAVLALSATAANAGIIIPAGDWTLDVSGNVNTFATWTKSNSRNTIQGALTGNVADSTINTVQNMTTGLLPNFLSIGGSTRQNDLDVTFAISIQPGTTTTGPLQSSGQENRQAFLTFGDKSWGNFKLGRDLGIFASDAILSDMTLLGVGAPTSATAAGTTTLGRIGAGYIYADWKGQVSYTTPNFNGFQATVGLTQAYNASGTSAGNPATSVTNTARGGASPAYEGKASYSFAANDVTGKVWVSGIAQKIDFRGTLGIPDDTVAYGGDIGANVNVAGFGLTGYYYGGQGIGTTGFLSDSFNRSAATAAGTIRLRDSDGGYVQATYVLPTKTKVGVSWGISNLDRADGEAAGALVKENEMWTAGIYHPLTKHLNLVAEYNNLESESHTGTKNKNYSGSLGAILFF